MGNFIKKIFNRLKTYFSGNKINNQDISFEKLIELGRAENFHGNNKVLDVEIGKYSYVSFNSIIYHTSIGRYCSIGPNVVVGYGDHPIDMISTSPHVYLNDLIYEKHEIDTFLVPHFKKVQIENDVWVGANVYIKNGVKIGNGAIIGAGSVVLKDVGDYEIFGGVPAKFIRKRFDDIVINLLLKTNWWILDTAELKQFKETLNNPIEDNLKDMIKKLGHDK
jgi:acetyltransferase-like isoleucine patch superfamily enzyme